MNQERLGTRHQSFPLYLLELTVAFLVAFSFVAMRQQLLRIFELRPVSGPVSIYHVELYLISLEAFIFLAALVTAFALFFAMGMLLNSRLGFIPLVVLTGIGAFVGGFAGFAAITGLRYFAIPAITSGENVTLLLISGVPLSCGVAASCAGGYMTGLAARLRREPERSRRL